jgi:uncharacterized protein with NRDE domain
MIRAPEYGTRCSTVLLVDHRGRARFEERSFAPDGSTLTHCRYELELSEPAWLENRQD